MSFIVKNSQYYYFIKRLIILYNISLKCYLFRKKNINANVDDVETKPQAPNVIKMISKRYQMPLCPLPEICCS